MKVPVKIPTGVLEDDHKRRQERLIQQELSHQIDQKMFLLLMKKRGIAKDKKTEKLFVKVAPYLPCEQIIEIYTE